MFAEVVLLLVAGIAGGAVNAIAGGGTFFTFPAFLAVGIDPLTANASNAVAIYPGHAAAIPAYKVELRAAGKSLFMRCVIACIGGLIGAGLLLWAGNKVFTHLIPFLLLAATILFAFGPAIANWSNTIKGLPAWFKSFVEFLFAIYGGYFGAGLGVLLMASLTIAGIKDVQMANAQKNLIATLITSLSVITFIAADVIAWKQTLIVLFGAILGGYFGARISKNISTTALRKVVIIVGIILSIYYFFR